MLRGSYILVGLVFVIVNAPSFGQVNPPDARLEAPLLDWSHARQAIRQVETWVRLGAVESAGDPVLVTDLVAGRVTLRWLGRTMGVGDKTLSLDSPQRGAVDLTDLIRTASAHALEGVRAQLIESQRRASAKSQGQADQKSMTLREIGRDLLVDLQLARRPQWISIPSAAASSAIYKHFVPGYHGLVMASETAGGGQAWLWPATILASNLQPRAGLIHLAHLIDVDLNQLVRVARPGGPHFARFEVIHVVRSQPDMPIMELIRGQSPLPPRPVDGATLESMSRRLTGFLKGRIRKDGSLAGTYLPSADRYGSVQAKTHDAALAAYALMRRGTYLSNLQASPKQIHDVQHATRRTLEHLIGQLIQKERTNEPAASALVLMALSEATHLSDWKPQRNALAKQLLATYENGRFHVNEEGNSEAVNPPVHALIVAALASLYEQTRDAMLRPILAESLDELWEELEQDQILAMLPWLALAEFRARDRFGDGDSSGSNRSILAAVIDRLHAAQIVEAPELGPADTIGAFDLGQTPPGPFGPVSAHWRTAQLLVFLAACLTQDDFIDPSEPLEHLLRCGLAARLIGQLMVDRPGTYYMRSLRDALGGVRLSLSDNRLGAGPAAMALLATTQLQIAILATEG